MIFVSNIVRILFLQAKKYRHMNHVRKLKDWDPFQLDHS